MTELLITVFLLLAAENAVFSTVFKNKGFMTYESECGNPFKQAFFSGLFVALPFLASHFLFETDNVVIDILMSVVFASLLILYRLFIKKDGEWYFSLATLINAGIGTLLASSSAVDVIDGSLVLRAAVGGIAVAFCTLCFCGVKDNFCRRKRSIPMLCIYSVCLIALALVAFAGFAD